MCDVALAWDDDPLWGTGRLVGIEAEAITDDSAVYRIMRRHGSVFVPTYSSSTPDADAGPEHGPACVYGVHMMSVKMCADEPEIIRHGMTREEALERAKAWCNEHSARRLRSS